MSAIGRGALSNNEPADSMTSLHHVKTRELEEKRKLLEDIMAQRGELLSQKEDLLAEIRKKTKLVDELKMKFWRAQMKTDVRGPTVQETVRILRHAYMDFDDRHEFTTTLQDMKACLLSKWYEMGMRVGREPLMAWEVAHTEAVRRCLGEIWRLEQDVATRNESLKWFAELVKGIDECEQYFEWSDFQKLMNPQILRLVDMSFDEFKSYEDPNMMQLRTHELLCPALMPIWKPSGWDAKMRECLEPRGRAPLWMTLESESYS